MVVHGNRCGIYRIRPLKGGWAYVGSSKNIPSRIRSHISRLIDGLHANARLQSEWKRTSGSGLIFEIVEFCDEHELQAKESAAIKREPVALNFLIPDAKKDRAIRTSVPQIKIFEINGVRYDSAVTAAADLGIHPLSVQRHVRKNGAKFNLAVTDAGRKKPITIAGVLYQSHADAAAALGTSRASLSRLSKSQGAVSPYTKNRPKPVVIRGLKFPSVSAAAKHFGIPRVTLHDRLKHSPAEAAMTV